MFTRCHQTVAVILTTILAMVLNPGAQKKAQAELDAVVGRSRLPGYDDEPSLPYVRALILESMRWRPVSPLGIESSTLVLPHTDEQHYLKASLIITCPTTSTRAMSFPKVNSHGLHDSAHTQYLSRLDRESERLVLVLHYGYL